MTQLELPYPPSLNHYWRHVGAKVLISAEGRRYRKEVFLVVLLSRVRPTPGRLAVEVDVYPPDARRRDLDNTQKALLDAMKHAGVYGDDCQIDDLRIMRCPGVKGGKVVVRIRQIVNVREGVS